MRRCDPRPSALKYLDYRIAYSGWDDFLARLMQRGALGFGRCAQEPWLDHTALRAVSGKAPVLFVLGVRLFQPAAAPEFAFDACTFAAVFKQRDPISIGLHCRST
jgi:hypothetical protein